MHITDHYFASGSIFVVAVLFVNFGGVQFYASGNLFTPLMSERHGEQQLWTLCISGDVDRIFIVSIAKVC